MTAAAIIALISRWAHILAAITAVGGSIFARFAVLPSLAELPEEQRKQVHEAIRRRWLKFVIAAISFLLASGLYNVVTMLAEYKPDKPYHMLFGIKFLLALVVFYIASTLVGRSKAAEKMRGNAKFWLSLNVALSVAIVLISGYLRSIDRHPKGEAEPNPPPVAASAPTGEATG